MNYLKFTRTLPVSYSKTQMSVPGSHVHVTSFIRCAIIANPPLVLVHFALKCLAPTISRKFLLIHFVYLLAYKFLSSTIVIWRHFSNEKRKLLGHIRADKNYSVTSVLRFAIRTMIAAYATIGCRLPAITFIHGLGPMLSAIQVAIYCATK